MEAANGGATSPSLSLLIQNWLIQDAKQQCRIANCADTCERAPRESVDRLDTSSPVHTSRRIVPEKLVVSSSAVRHRRRRVAPLHRACAAVDAPASPPPSLSRDPQTGSTTERAVNETLAIPGRRVLASHENVITTTLRSGSRKKYAIEYSRPEAVWRNRWWFGADTTANHVTNTTQYESKHEMHSRKQEGTSRSDGGTQRNKWNQRRTEPKRNWPTSGVTVSRPSLPQSGLSHSAQRLPAALTAVRRGALIWSRQHDHTVLQMCTPLPFGQTNKMSAEDIVYEIHTVDALNWVK